MKLLPLACLAIFATAQAAFSASLTSVDMKEVRNRVGTDRSSKLEIGVEVEGMNGLVLNGEKYDARFSAKELNENLSKKLDIPVRVHVNQVLSAVNYQSDEYVSRTDGQYLINSVSQYWFDKDVFKSRKNVSQKIISDALLLPHEPLSKDSLSCLSKQVKELSSALAELKDSGYLPESLAIHIVDANNCEVNAMNKGLTCKELMKKADLNFLQIKSYMGQMKSLSLKDDNGEDEQEIIRASVDTSGKCEVTSKDDLKKRLSAQGSKANAQAEKQSETDKEKAYNELFGN